MYLKKAIYAVYKPSRTVLQTCNFNAIYEENQLTWNVSVLYKLGIWIGINMGEESIYWSQLGGLNSLYQQVIYEVSFTDIHLLSLNHQTFYIWSHNLNSGLYSTLFYLFVSKSVSKWSLQSLFLKILLYKFPLFCQLCNFLIPTVAWAVNFHNVYAHTCKHLTGLNPIVFQGQQLVNSWEFCPIMVSVKTTLLCCCSVGAAINELKWIGVAVM